MVIESLDPGSRSPGLNPSPGAGQALARPRQAGAGGGGGGAIRRGLEPFLWACKELGGCGSGMGKRVLFGLPRKLKFGSLGGGVGLGSRPPAV